MTTVTHGGVVAHESQAIAARWLYRALAPSPETGPDGVPTAMLMVSGEGATLQLGVHLDPPSGVLEELRDVVAEQSGVDAALVQLAPDVRSVDGVLLGADSRLLAETTSSGYPPFATLFQVTLDADATSAARAALAGAPGRLEVRYDLTLTDGTPARAVADAGTWFTDHPRDPVVVASPDRTENDRVAD